MRPRGTGRGYYLELRARKDVASVWVFNYFTYGRNGRRRHRTFNLGTVQDLPTLRKAEAAADIARARLMKEPQPLRHAGRRTSAAKAICSDELYAELVIEQCGRCAICGEAPQRLCIDHDHKTGQLRGLLCSRCNSGIGLLDDNPDILLIAARYIERAEQMERGTGFEPVTLGLGSRCSTVELTPQRSEHN